jgi:hypothetical protein
MSSQLPSTNPTAYLGVRPTNPGNIWFRNRDPDNALDTNNYQPGDTWMNPILNHIFMLMRDYNLSGGGKAAVWVPITGGGGGSGIQNLEGDLGPVVGPVGGVCDIIGNPVAGVVTTGILPNTIEVNVENASAGANVGACQKGVSCFNSADFTVINGFVSTIAGTESVLFAVTDDANAVPPSAGGDLNVNGDITKGIKTVGNIGLNQVLITADNATAGTSLTATKGVSSFNDANFTVVNGFVSAIAGASGIQTTTGNDNVAVGPTGGGTIFIKGDTSQGIEVDGVALTNTETITAYNANTAGGKGVSTYTASEFNVAAGLVSLTGKCPTKPMMKANLSVDTGAVTGNNTIYQIVFDNVIYDTNGNYNNGTGVYTASVAGVYAVSAFVTANNIQPNMYLEGCYISLNGVNEIMEQENPYPTIYNYLAQQSNFWNLSSQFYLNIGDQLTVSLNIAGNATPKVVTVKGTIEYSSFCVSLIG